MALAIYNYFWLFTQLGKDESSSGNAVAWLTLLKKFVLSGFYEPQYNNLASIYHLYIYLRPKYLSLAWYSYTLMESLEYSPCLYLESNVPSIGM